MKKIIAILMALTLLATACVLAGCNNHTDIQDDKLSVVTTIFPEYDWVKNILGDKADRAELTMLLDNGVDLHSYQPTVDDMVEISNCDLFIYVGGESDGWVEDALKNPKNPNRKVINLLEVLGDGGLDGSVLANQISLLERIDTLLEGDLEFLHESHVLVVIKLVLGLLLKLKSLVVVHLALSDVGEDVLRILGG